MYVVMKKNESSGPILIMILRSYYYRIPNVTRVRIILTVQSIFLARDGCRIPLYAIDTYVPGIWSAREVLYAPVYSAGWFWKI